MSRKRSNPHYRQEVSPDQKQKPKIVRKNYHVTSQTAYHITRLALEEKTSEGRIIDKIIRNYLVMRNPRTFL